MTRIRSLLLWLGLANFAFAVLVAMTTSAMAGLSYTIITSTYRELDANGVIDQSRLTQLWGAEYADNWHKVVDRLVGEPLKALYHTTYLPTGLLVLNSIILIISWWRIRGGNQLHATDLLPKN